MNSVLRIIILVLLCTAGVPAVDGFSAEKPEQPTEPAAKEEKKKPEPVPGMGDVIPAAMDLSGKVVELENRLQSGLDTSALKKKYGEVKERLHKLSQRFEELKESKEYRQLRLLQLKQAVGQESDLLKTTNQPLRDAVNQLESLRKEWLAERKRWEKWRSTLVADGKLEHLQSAFTRAEQTINKALGLIVPRLEDLMALQQEAGRIQGELDKLAAEVNHLFGLERKEVLLTTSPPMFSSEYFAQFRIEFMHGLTTGFRAVNWWEGPFFDRQGWLIVIQLVLTVLVIAGIYRNREALHESERWSFVARRPISTGIYASIMATLILYDYRGAPPGWTVAVTLLWSFSFVRLMYAYTEIPWKRHFVLGLAVLLIATRFLFAISLPLPLTRMYLVIGSLAAIAFCLRWATVSSAREESPMYARILQGFALIFGVIFLAEIWGKTQIGQYLFVAVPSGVSIVLSFALFVYLIQGGLEWSIRRFIAPRVTLSETESDTVIRHSAFIINVGLMLMLISVLMVSWRFFDSFYAAGAAMFDFGFNLGTHRISTGTVLTAIAVVYGSFVASRVLIRVFIDRELSRRQVQQGVRISIAALIHYALLFLGFLAALTVIGFDLTKLTIVLGALGVGIGFGLQAIVNNFVSGLILLVERPVRVGDYIEIGDNWAEIRKIGLRATTVRTFDYADVIVPNSELVANRVTNWTLSTRVVRLIIPVGVAYGSDLEAVMSNLADAAAENPRISNFPEPQVLFQRFGDNALEFELRCWVRDVDDLIKVKSELHRDICRRFREAGIEIAFPQRDVHVRSIETPVVLTSSKDD